MNRTIYLCFYSLGLLLLLGCQEDLPQNPDQGARQNEDTQAWPVPLTGDQPEEEYTANFTLSVRETSLQLPPGFPFLHSAAAAQQGAEVLLIGGRTGGFHGISEGLDPFGAKKAGSSIWVINLEDFSFYQLPLSDNYPGLMQLKGANFATCQDGDTLFIAGGYGLLSPEAPRSNTTFDQIMAIQVSRMIEEAKKGAAGNPRNAILRTTRSPFVQVSGGELFRESGDFYLMFGQNYEGEYTVGRQGTYTNAVRRFSWEGAVLSDTASLIAAHLHRRDLNVARVIQPGYPRYVAYSGVFDKDDNGFVHPVYIDINPIGKTFTASLNMDITQKTSNYKAAVVSVFEPLAGRNTHLILGGIGRFQYHPEERSWEEGDNGALLPFVKTITHSIWQNGWQTMHYQLPPQEAELPALLGANALFLPRPVLEYSKGVIDYSKLSPGLNHIGWLYGGILAEKPTSSAFFPTSINNKIYEVMLSTATAQQ